MINKFDAYVLAFVAQYGQKSAIANKFMVDFFTSHTMKGLPIAIGLWLLWFSRKLQYRAAVIEAFVGYFCALAISRVLQNLMPWRPRPLHAGGFSAPIGTDPAAMEDWSSFPSDHAAAFFAVSAAIWRVSRPLGALCFGWSIFVVSLPRVYLGYHYPSDIVGGAAVGLFASLVFARPITNRVMPLMETLEARYEAIFYAAFFVLSYEFVTMFDNVRRLGRLLLKLL